MSTSAGLLYKAGVTDSIKYNTGVVCFLTLSAITLIASLNWLGAGCAVTLLFGLTLAFFFSDEEYQDKFIMDHSGGMLESVVYVVSMDIFGRIPTIILVVVIWIIQLQSERISELMEEVEKMKEQLAKAGGPAGPINKCSEGADVVLINDINLADMEMLSDSEGSEDSEDDGDISYEMVNFD